MVKLLDLLQGGGSGALGGLTGVANTAWQMEKTGIIMIIILKILNAQKERQALLPDNVTLGSNATFLGYD